MKRVLTILLFITMLFCVSAQNSITVTGTVRDKLTHPVEGITVAYQCDGTDVILPVQTDESGYFEFSFEQLGIDENTLPATINLGANYPNPFNPGTVIPLTTNTPGQFLIHDLLGRRVQSIQITHAGHFTLAWGGMFNSGLPAPAGIYFYSFQTVESRLTGKMILLDGGGNTGLSLTGDNKTKQQRQSKQVTECGNYTIVFSAEHITDVTLDLGETGYTEDTNIEQEVNRGPKWICETDYSVEVDSVLMIDLGECFYNDDETFYSVNEPLNIYMINDSLFIEVDDTIGFIVNVGGIDSDDIDLIENAPIDINGSVYWDTTSHDFFWEIDTLGENHSYLKDVAIINENDIWVVGNIETDSATYNAAHWGGNEWELILISPGGLINPISSIYAISENDIWFGKMGLPIHWDGEIYYKYTPANSTHPGQPTINAIWGTSSSNMYFVGNSGSIVHYDGVDFIEMESGTDMKLRDVHGTSDAEHVFACGYDNSIATYGAVALEIVNNDVNILYEITEYGQTGEFGTYIHNVYVLGDTAYFAAQLGLWKYNFIESTSALVTGEDGYTIGNGSISNIIVNYPNDIIIGTTWGHLFTFNGTTWLFNRELLDLFNYDGDFINYKIRYKDNRLLLVGHFGGNSHAIVIKGIRLD